MPFQIPCNALAFAQLVSKYSLQILVPELSPNSSCARYKPAMDEVGHRYSAVNPVRIVRRRRTFASLAMVTKRKAKKCRLALTIRKRSILLLPTMGSTTRSTCIDTALSAMTSPRIAKVLFQLDEALQQASFRSPVYSMAILLLAPNRVEHTHAVAVAR